LPATDLGVEAPADLRAAVHIAAEWTSGRPTQKPGQEGQRSVRPWFSPGFTAVEGEANRFSHPVFLQIVDADDGLPGLIEGAVVTEALRTSMSQAVAGTR
jgi:hypothetical protein